MRGLTRASRLELMREHIKQSKRGDGPLGIRIGVWLIALGAALVGVLTVCLPPSHRAIAPNSALESLPHQEASTRETSSRRARGIEFIPATYESGASFDFDEALLRMAEQLMEDRRTWQDSSHDR